jgi:hypothetical protein
MAGWQRRFDRFGAKLVSAIQPSSTGDSGNATLIVASAPKKGTVFLG